MLLKHNIFIDPISLTPSSNTSPHRVSLGVTLEEIGFREGEKGVAYPSGSTLGGPLLEPLSDGAEGISSV